MPLRGWRILFIPLVGPGCDISGDNHDVDVPDNSPNPLPEDDVQQDMSLGAIKPTFDLVYTFCFFSDPGMSALCPPGNSV